MKKLNLAITVIGFSALLGLVIAGEPQLPELQLPVRDSSTVSGESGNSSLEYGSAHEHALFYVVVNGTELDFTAERYQLNSRYVHLESNRSDVVHKHAEGVTWNYFLETINVSINRTEERICVERPGERHCGEGRVALEKSKNLSADITQGDSLVVVIGAQLNATVEDYLKRQLPQIYKPEASRGYRA